MFGDRDPMPEGGPQLTWLESRLSEADRLGLRSIVLLHLPPFSSGKEERGAPWVKKRVVEDILDRHPVALVLSGHIHAYERIVRPGFEGRPVNFVVSGGAGGRFFQPRDRREEGSVIFVEEVRNFVLLELGPDGLSGRALPVQVPGEEWKKPASPLDVFEARQVKMRRLKPAPATSGTKSQRPVRPTDHRTGRCRWWASWSATRRASTPEGERARGARPGRSALAMKPMPMLRDAVRLTPSRWSSRTRRRAPPRRGPGTSRCPSPARWRGRARRRSWSRRRCRCAARARRCSRTAAREDRDVGDVEEGVREVRAPVGDAEREGRAAVPPGHVDRVGPGKASWP